MPGPLDNGQIVGEKYRIDGFLGQGASAWVYRARPTEISSLQVAVKVLRGDLVQDAKVVQRFKREAETAAILKSTHTVRVMDSGLTDGGLPFIALDYVEGETLANKITRQGRVSEKAVAIIGIQVCRALKEAHAAGIVHRDLKPSNIYLARDPSDGTSVARVLDFGIAEIIG
ncbi:MAG: serine/threonine-protein kinase, partial [Bradymonadia bacterium]